RRRTMRTLMTLSLATLLHATIPGRALAVELAPEERVALDELREFKAALLELKQRRDRIVPAILPWSANAATQADPRLLWHIVHDRSADFAALPKGLRKAVELGHAAKAAVGPAPPSDTSRPR